MDMTIGTFSLVLILVLLGLVWALRKANRPLTPDEARQALGRLWQRFARRGAGNAQAWLAVPAWGLEEQWGPAAGQARPFNAASVGKLMTLTLALRAAERGLISLSDPVVKYLPEDLLDGLFVFQGVDRRTEVTLEHLLSHTSGLLDPFTDKGRDGQTMSECLVRDRQRFWNPRDLLDRQRGLSLKTAPGQGFHYSDAGYDLMGFVLEKVSGKSLEQLHEDEFFRPLGMKSTWFPHRSKPLAGGGLDLGPTRLLGRRISMEDLSLTAAWAGGAFNTTLEDLAAFGRAFFAGDLLSEESKNLLSTFPHRFRLGIAYGLGVMEYRMGEFFPLLKDHPRWRGHMGILATHLVYDFHTGALFVSSFGDDRAAAASFEHLIGVGAILKRVRIDRTESDCRQDPPG